MTCSGSFGHFSDEEFTEDTQPVISTGDGNEAEEEQEEEEEFDWSIEQTPYTEQASPLDCPRYGFANQKSGVFQRLQVSWKLVPGMGLPIRNQECFKGCRLVENGSFCPPVSEMDCFILDV